MARRIYVSRDYREPFEAVYQLLRSGALAGLPYQALPEGVIFDGTYEYELSARRSAEQQNVTHYFAEDGATWFRPLRGETVENDDDIWCNFMITVREEYHKRYSVLEYEQEIPKSAADFQKLERKASATLLRFVGRFFPHVPVKEGDVHTVRDERVFEDIFGVSMRVELSAEATSGASLPLLCKVYFVRNGKSIKPISWQVAKQYDRDILSIVPNDADAPCRPDDALIDHTLVALESFINDPANNFAEYTWLGEIEMPTTDEEEQAANRRDEADKDLSQSEIKQRRALRKLYVQMAHENFALQCQRVDVLYISHIKVEAFVCDLYHAGKPMLRAEIGINDALTIRCLACDDAAVLVDRDEIFYEVDGEEKSVVLDRTRDDFGITEDTYQEILAKSALSDHLKLIFCHNKTCAKIRCASRLFTAYEEEFCRDCRYPDVVYADYDGALYYTPNLVTVTDTLRVGKVEAVMEEGTLAHCALCHRVFSPAKLTAGGYCHALCARALRPDGEAAALYRRYRGMLPFATRLFGGGGRYCFEDEELILFVLGNKKYIFNKLDVTERGYLKAPRRLK